MNTWLSIKIFASIAGFVQAGSHVKISLGIDAHAIAATAWIKID